MAGGMSSFGVGQYLPGDSVVHRRDPRVKLVTAVLYVAGLFLVGGAAGLGVLAAALIVVILAGRIPLGYLWRGLRPLALLLLITLVIHSLSYPGAPILDLGPLAVTWEGLTRGAYLTGRLGLLLVAGVLLTVTTPPVALTDGIEWLLSPLQRIRFPAAEIALMMTMALRFIPALLEEFDTLVRAQKARGIDVRTRDPRRVGRILMPLVVPLFVQSFRRADVLATAMSSRCYRGAHGRTRYREMRFGAGDGAAAVLVLAVLAVALSVGRTWS